jgi:hypothetical protein
MTSPHLREIMTIPGMKLAAYLSSMSFPVTVLPEMGDEPATEVDLPGLRYLMENGLVVGFGSYRKVKTLRAFRQLKTAYILRSKSKWHVISEAGRTVVRGETLTDGARPWKHHAGRCGAWGKGHVDGGSL